MNLELIDIIKKVKEKITDDSDMLWTHYDNTKQLKGELETNVQKIKFGETRSLEELRMLFAPTATLQELAIGNGWSDEYLKLTQNLTIFIRQ